MRRRLIMVFVLVLIGFNSCVHDPIASVSDSPNEIHLKWNASYPNEKISDAIIGLNWTLSHVGARNTNNTTNRFQINGHIITIYLPQIGFSNHAYSAMYSLHESIQKSDEYIKNGNIDLGRYITLLIGSSAHYYRLVNMPNHLKDVISKYSVNSKKGFVNRSSISPNHRIIAFSSPQNLNQFFLSSEIDSVTRKILEFETMEITSNGQVIFGIFNTDSQLVYTADPSISLSGKPAKCMWCHESKVNPLFSNQIDSIGYLTSMQLHDSLDHFGNLLVNSQKSLSNGVDFTRLNDHIQMELQYIMFKQPSSMRLANEWNMSITKVELLLVNESRFTYPEFPFLPEGFHRDNIEKHAPYDGLLTSPNVRESSNYEVNYID